MAAVDRPLVYAIADAIGIALDFDPARMELRGSDDVVANIGGQRLRVPLDVVSSRMEGGVYMVIVRTIGNLALLLTSKRAGNKEVIEMHLLNLAKMDRAGGWLEKEQPKSVNEALKKLGGAVVKSFVKLGRGEWEEAA